ncbi:MAG TPA: hypothetical protein VKL99_09090 [Candidatus Angelobacter sp.]|nr:hypothetical protein [Candidatus Angelobacter sp.]
MAQQKMSSKAQSVTFRSGEPVPVSGLWRPEHEKCNNAAELWIRKEELFPPCPQCGSPAAFTLLEEVQHISEDSDFQ